MPALTRRRSPEPRQQKITLGEMRASGVRGLLIYCSDYKCSNAGDPDERRRARRLDAGADKEDRAAA
jgi:hypothetical protein